MSGDDDKQELPYGSWPSPITAAALMEGAVGVGEIRADGEDVWWSEQRPSEGGRYQLVRRSSSGNRHDLFPAWDSAEAATGWNARTAVMEYGGGAWGVRDREVVFANWADQRLYVVGPSGQVEALTAEPPAPRAWRFSEPVWLDDAWLVCVREDHAPDTVASHGEAMTELVAIPLDKSAVEDPSQVHVLVSGPDFVHSPVVDGDRLAWIQWDHPRMPWDGTELVLATVVRDAQGAPVGIEDRLVVAGGPTESVVQPGFVSGGHLVFCSDRTGWWQPYRACEEELPPTPMHQPDRHRARPRRGLDIDSEIPQPATDPLLASPVPVEIGGPMWVGGLRWWTELPGERLLVSMASDGSERLGLVEPDGSLIELFTPFTDISQVVVTGDGRGALVVAGTPVSETAPYLLDVSERREGDLGDEDPALFNRTDDAPTVTIDRLMPHRELPFAEEWFSIPEPISFPSAGGRTAHGLFYPPRHPDAAGPAGARPPLVVMIHGGPTSSARNLLSLPKQFWTSRGFAVVDVDYGGSTGYGRPFREELNGQWGIVDVDDAVASASYLASEGKADGAQLAIRGGSAGGYTVLCALCFHDVFKAGASHFGVADLSALAQETHKFESRYLDGMVGPWPEARDVYEARSPIHHTDGFAAPLIVFQGSEDVVVPPNQSQMIVDALAAKGVPHAYLLFEGEQHGFRKAENIIRALEAELWFYGKVFGFTPADPIAPVEGAVGL
jgi:dipeptidyl aminopeptidase/acylaminoacyl peptidase